MEEKKKRLREEKKDGRNKEVFYVLDSILCVDLFSVFLWYLSIDECKNDGKYRERGRERKLGQIGGAKVENEMKGKARADLLNS